MRSTGVLDRATGSPGSHVCWSFDDDLDFRTAAGAFLAEGLAAGERLVYVADAPAQELASHLVGLDVDRLRREGTLDLLPVRDLYEPDGTFDLDRQVERYGVLVDAAVDAGYQGMRLAADASVLALSAGACRRFAAYELAVDRLIASRPMTALCAYRTDLVGDGLAQLLAVHPQHHGADVGYHAFWDDDRVRFTGELDCCAESVLDLAIETIMRSADRCPTVDLGDVDFADVHTMVRLSGLADSLAAQDRQLRVTGSPKLVRRCCALLRLDGLAAALEPA